MNIIHIFWNTIVRWCKVDKKLEYVKQRLKNSFDVKYREINTKIGKCTLVFIDDLCGVSFISEYIITPLKKQQYTYTNVEEVVYNVLDINIANYAKDLDDAILHVLSGDVILLFEDFEKIIYCEVKGFVRRGISIPVTESVIKGPREGFN